MDSEEKEDLKRTYLSTLKNSTTVKIKDTPKRNMSKKRVSFVLENNIIHMIPYYSKIEW